MKFNITAVIPVAQYANIQPNIEVEAKTFDEAYAEAMPYIERIWSEYGEKPLQTRTEAPQSTTDDFVTITPFVGEPFLYSDSRHEYRTLDGKPMISGSAFAEKFTKPFNKAVILPKFAQKHGVEEKEIEDMWQTKAEVSTTFGTAIHKALEFYGNHRTTIEKTKGTFEIHPVLMPIVKAFYDSQPNTHAIHEIFINSGDRVGQVDRLVITKPKTCIIEDWKTNGDMNKGSGKMLPPYDDLDDTAINHYRLQLSFYKKIMVDNGWTVEALRLHHFTGKWETIEIEEVK